MSYNLLHEPWIPVVALDGERRTVGLIELLESARRLRGLDLDLAAREAAVLRLVLAVLYTYAEQGLTANEWRERMWERWTGGDPSTVGDAAREVTAGLLADADRFDLLHPERPFYQTAGLTAAKGGHASLHRFLIDVPAGEQYLSVRAGEGLESMSLAEAAVELVCLHAYDTAGIKTGAAGDPAAPAGKSYGSPVGPCGSLGLTWLEGANLAETLMLNLVPPTTEREAGQDPAWRRTWNHTYAAEPIAAANRAQLLTWQSRRVRLHVADGRVTGVVICKGDPLDVGACAPIEAMSAWAVNERRSTPGDAVMRSVRFDADTPSWQLLRILLDGGERYRTRPEVLDWLGAATASRVPPAKAGARFVAVNYGAQLSTVKDVADRRLPRIPVGLLTDGDPRMLIAVTAATSKALGLLGHFGGEVAYASGAAPDRVAARAQSLRVTAEGELSPRFARWLAQWPAEGEHSEAGRSWLASREARNAPEQTPVAAHMRAWWSQVHRFVLAEAAEIAQNAGALAWKGRVADGRLVNTALAERKLRAQLLRLADELVPAGV